MGRGKGRWKYEKGRKWVNLWEVEERVKQIVYVRMGRDDNRWCFRE